MLSAHSGRSWKRYLLSWILLSAVALLLTACPAPLRQPPIAIIRASPTTGEAPMTVSFDGSQSSDPDGTIVSFQWDFNGDGIVDATGVTQTHSYEAAGLFKAVLIVTDNNGLIDKDTAFINILRGSIYFASDRLTAPKFELFKMDTDGTNQTRITNEPGANDLWPALLPNTRALLAFTSDRDTPGLFDIFKANADGTLATNLTLMQTMSHEIQPSWSPDGSKIAFASNQNGIFEIFIMSADGVILAPTPFISQKPKHSITPAWSPLGDEIAFVRFDPVALDTNLMKANATTGAVSNLLVDPAFDDGAVGGPIFAGLTLGSSRISWSPDGSFIVFSSSRTITGTGGTDIYVIAAPGTQPPVNINTAFGTPPYSNTFPIALSVNTTANEFDPFWLPNGKEIAFVRETAPGVFQLFKVNIITGAITQLTTIGNNIMPACEPLCPP